MPDIERWEVWECPTNGHTFAYPSVRAEGDEYPKSCPGCGISLVHRDGRIAEVGYQGAVKALDEIDALITEALDTWTWPVSFAQFSAWKGRLADATASGRTQSS